MTLLLNQLLSIGSYDNIELYALLFQVAVNITDGIHEVLEKYLLQYKYQHLLTILFLQGLFDTFLLCLTSIYLLFYISDWTEINNWLKTYIKQLIAYSFGSFGYHFFRITINDRMSPTHRIISDSLYAILSVYYYLFRNFSLNFFIISFGYLIAFYGSLVYHQVLIIRLFGADRDTKYVIEKRGIKEEEDSLAFMKESEKANNTSQSSEIILCESDNISLV